MIRFTGKLVAIGLLAFGVGAYSPRPHDDSSNPAVTVPYETSKKLVNFLRDPTATTGDGGCLPGEQCKWAVLQYNSIINSTCW